MNTRQYNSILLVFGLLISAAASSISANPAEVVRPEFLNELRIGVENPPAGQSNSMVLFGGNIDSPETAPSGAGPDTGTILLIESSFGQAFATDIPYPDFILDAALAAQRMLYAPAGWSRADVVGSDLVFRYKTLLYDGNNGGVAPNPAQVSSHFGDAERLKFV